MGIGTLARRVQACPTGGKIRNFSSPSVRIRTLAKGSAGHTGRSATRYRTGGDLAARGAMHDAEGSPLAVRTEPEDGEARSLVELEA